MRRNSKSDASLQMKSENNEMDGKKHESMRRNEYWTGCEENRSKQTSINVEENTAQVMNNTFHVSNPENCLIRAGRKGRNSPTEGSLKIDGEKSIFPLEESNDQAKKNVKFASKWRESDREVLNWELHTVTRSQCWVSPVRGHSENHSWQPKAEYISVYWLTWSNDEKIILQQFHYFIWRC